MPNRWKDKGQTVAVYLTQEQVLLLQRVAAIEQTSVSDLVRRAVNRFLILPEAATISNRISEAS